MAKLTTFHIGGVHPDDSKIARDCAIEVLPLPQTVYVSMAQHLGAPAKPVVAVGDKVKVGTVLAEPGGFISAFVHSPASGTVKSIGPRKDIAGNAVTHIEITVEGDEWEEGIDRSPSRSCRHLQRLYIYESRSYVQTRLQVSPCRMHGRWQATLSTAG